MREILIKFGLFMVVSNICYMVMWVWYDYISEKKRLK